MHHLVWPLYAAGMSDLSSGDLRRWIINMLYFIALRIGTRQAVVLAETLKETQKAALVRVKFVEPAVSVAFRT